MRRFTVWGAGLLAVLAALLPGKALGQFSQPIGDASPTGAPDYAPPANANLPLPLYSTHPDLGGLFVSGGFVMYRQTNPLKDQPVAYRGLIITDPVASLDPSVTGFPGTFVDLGQQLHEGIGQGTFVGSRSVALDVHQVTGPNTYQPGFSMEGGWKFQDGSTLTLGWMYLAKSNLIAAATLTSIPNQQFRADQANSFLTSFVYNFPAEFGGPPSKITAQVGLDELSDPVQGAAFGIWNGSSVQTLQFEQKTQQIQATYRVPFYETECYRVSGLVGPRFFWIWERFTWRTTDIGLALNEATETIITLPTQPDWSAVYTNIVSNRMYGVFAGFSQEYYIGKGFAFMLDSNAAALLDIVKEQAKYELGAKDMTPQAKRRRTDYTIVPEVQATARVMYYPWEGIQISVGWDAMAFFNTISSPRPIDFNYGSLAPGWESTFRIFDGFQASLALVF